LARRGGTKGHRVGGGKKKRHVVSWSIVGGANRPGLYKGKQITKFIVKRGQAKREWGTVGVWAQKELGKHASKFETQGCKGLKTPLGGGKDVVPLFLHAKMNPDSRERCR